MIGRIVPTVGATCLQSTYITRRVECVARSEVGIGRDDVADALHGNRACRRECDVLQSTYIMGSVDSTLQAGAWLTTDRHRRTNP